MPPADPSAAEIARLQEAARRLEQRLMLEGLSPSGVTRAQWRDPPFLNNLGAALMDAKRPDLALEAFQIAAGFQPALADIRVNQALALERLARLEEAAQVMQSAVALNPDAFGLHHRLGSLRLKLEQPQAAEAACRAAIALKPDHAPAYIGLGAALRRQDRRPEAEVAYREAIRLDPEIAMAHYNLANALQEMGRDEEAEAEYLQAMALRPDWPSARFNHGLFLLKQGRFAEGWEPYELRFHPDLTGKPERVFNTPRWNGEPLAGKTILITAEQGLGDVIQCARYVPRLAEMGAKVIIEAPAPLLGLLGRLEGVAQMIAPGSPEPAADFHCPWFSLPRGFKARLEDPTTPVYLTPAASLVAFWRARLGPGRKIGIVWQGNPAAKVERGRSFPLAALRPVADAAGVIGRTQGSDHEGRGGQLV